MTGTERPILDGHVSLREAAQEVYGSAVSEWSLRRWIAQGVGRSRLKLPAVRVCGRYFVRIEDVREFSRIASDPEQYRRQRRNSRCAEAIERLKRHGA